MAFDIMADRLYELRISAQSEGQSIQNILHLGELVAPTPPDPQPSSAGVLAAIRTNLILAKMAPAMNSKIAFDWMTLTEVLSFGIVPPGGTQKPYVYGAQDQLVMFGDTGSKVGDMPATFTAQSIRKRTTTAGPIGPTPAKVLRGGMRLGPPTEADSPAGAPNEWTPGQYTLLTAVADYLAFPLGFVVGAATMRWRLASKSLALVNFTPWEASGWITTALASPLVSSQVSRKQRFRPA